VTSPTDPLRSRPDEAERDQAQSAFTTILRRLAEGVPTLLAVAFVDFEGECVDYFSSIDPYEAKVVAAQMSVVMESVTRAIQRLGWGDASRLEVLGASRELVVRRVNDEYALVVMRRADGQEPRLLAAVERAVEEFRVEVGEAAPHWEPSPPVLFVETRPAVGWPYAPVAFSHGGAMTSVTHVLGRWVEPTGETCFRVYTERGDELTLVHRPQDDRWTIRN
jgi:predicted regulator of Ras-like GTPase activity (Roadblock/LC7/MglB family)